MYEVFFENVFMFVELQFYERMNLVDVLEMKIFEEGECIICEKDDVDCMYFIEEGIV